jgi:hypothetical protein
MRDFESPILASKEKILVSLATFFAASKPPLSPKVKIPL